MLRKPAMQTISETSSSNFRLGSPAGVTQLMQRCVASSKSRTCCFPGGSDFTTQNGAARNVKGLLASQVFFPTVAGGPFAVRWLSACEALVAVRRCLLVSF